MVENCDVVVLGMGTCGEDASLRLARAGLRVVGIEERLIGGECPFWACLPSKSLIRSAGLVADARRADGLVGKVHVETDWSLIARRLREEVTGDWTDGNGVARFERASGRFLRGHGVVTGPRTVRVGDTEVRAERGVVVAVGSRPLIPPVPGLADVPYWTNHEAIQAEELPPSLVILGGGAVGCELGQVFARFGSDVTIVEGAPRVLPAEEPEVSAAVTAGLEGDGVTVLRGVRASAVRQDGTRVVVDLDDGRSVTAERILVAAGRVADADAVGVTSAGARTSRGFVEVDGHLRAADGLWAIGDVTGKGLLTHVALYQGTIAIEDVLGASPPPAEYAAMPRSVFTDPEVGAVGLTVAEAAAQGRDFTVVRKDLRATFRGWLHRTGNEGSITLVADRAENRLVGASVVGPRATDLVSFLGLAVHARIPVETLVRMIYAFPSFGGSIGEALGAYGRGLVQVMDPGSTPLVDDPR